VVAKLDRLARSVRHASAIIDDAIAKGWSLVVLDNALDLTTPGGRAMANMLATFAELERDLISSRTKDALAARKARGLNNGRTTAIPAGVLRRIVTSRNAGAPFSRIARELTAEGVLSPTGLPTWQESTVRRAYGSAMAHVREVSRRTGKAYEVHWRQQERKMQRTFTVKRDGERFALKVENEIAEGATTAPLVRRVPTVAQVSRRLWRRRVPD